MDMKTSPPSPSETKEQWSLPDLVEQQPGSRSREGLLKHWYRWTAPPEVPATASLAQRELVRRGQLTSTVLLIIIAVMILPALASLATGNFGLFINLLLSLIFELVAIWFNRRGMITVAGTIVLLVIGVGTALGLFFLPGGLDVSALPLFDLMVQAELVAVSLLPAASVFLVAGANILFFWATLAIVPHTPALNALLKERGYSILVVPVALQLIVAVVSFLWVQSTTRAIRRADRAEVIASLEHSLAQQTQSIADQKAQLEEGIAQLVQTHAQAANGQLHTRATLPADRSLWPLAGAFNTLLARFQRALQGEAELRQERTVLPLFLEALRQAQGGPIQHWERTGTSYDQVVQQYNLQHRQSALSPNPARKLPPSGMAPFSEGY